MMQVVTALERWPWTARIALVLALTAILAVLDSLTVLAISLAVFYLAPVALATWLLGRRVGVLIALVCGGIMLVQSILLHSGIWSPTARDTVIGISAVATLWNVAALVALFLASVWVLGSLRRALDTESELARTDYLTGVANSRHFLDQASVELYRAQRYRLPFAIGFMDIDDFKEINDQFGHSVGDTVLRTVARTIASQIRPTDVIARLGGDEFALLLHGTDAEAASAASQRILAQLQTAMHQRGWNITFSIGIATFIQPPSTVDEMLEAADHLMYEAKRAGKNQVRHASFKGSSAGET